MGEYDSPMRHLPFPLNQSKAIERTTEDDGECEPSSFVWPDDPDEKTLVPFYLSQREYTVLASAVDVGSDIAFGDDAVRVWWLWTRNMECAVPICDLVTAALLTCEDVQAAIATLIATNPAIQSSIRDFVLSDPAINQQISDLASQQALSILERERNLLKPEACDPDFIFNQVSVMVQLLHDLTEDLFEAIEVGTNALERASIITSGIPIFGQVVPADELLQFADQLIEEVQEDYIGAYDEALYDTIRCELFCLAQDDCTLSIDRAISYYEGKAAEAFPDDPWEALKAIIGYLNVGDFGTDTPVYLMHLLVLALIRQMQTVLGVDFGILALRVIAAGDDPNNDWETLCEDCDPVPPPDGCEDLTVSQGTWIPASGWGDWIPGEGLAPHDFSGTFVFRWQRPIEATGRLIDRFRIKLNDSYSGVAIGTGTGVYTHPTSSSDFEIDATDAPAILPYNTASSGPIEIYVGAYVVASMAIRVEMFCLLVDE